VAGTSQSYVCATRAFGGLAACYNSERVPRLELEAGLMEAMKAKLLGAEYLELFAQEVRSPLAEEARGAVTEADAQRARLARLAVEIERYADAIAGGLSSPTIIERLKAAERERAQLQAAATTKRPRTDSVARVIPNIEKLRERAVGEAERLLRKGDPEGARENLRAWMGEVRMTPRAEGGLVAEARLDGTALLQKVLGNQQNQRHRNVVAGAGF
jgi:hypothetical protein